jgi:hypothetical protein
MNLSRVISNRQICLEKHEKLPSEAHWHLMQELQRLSHARTQQWIEQSMALEQLRSESLDAFRKTIGEERFARYLKLHNRRIRNINTLRRQAAKNPAMLQKYHATCQRNRAATQMLAARMGVDLDEIQALRQRYAQAVDILIPQNTAAVVETDPKSLTAELGRDEWVVLTPPYTDKEIEMETDLSGSPGKVIQQDDVDAIADTGYIDYFTLINIENASNFDLVAYHSRVTFRSLLWLPDGCNALQIILIFENQDSRVNYSLSDEWGCSDFRLYFGGSGLIRIVPIWPQGDGQEIVTPLRNIEGEDGILDFRSPGLWDGVIYPPSPYHFWLPGEEVYSECVHFAGPFEPGSFLYVWGGMNFQHIVNVDDYTVASNLNYRLRLKSINIRVVS